MADDGNCLVRSPAILVENVSYYVLLLSMYKQVFLVVYFTTLFQ
jgi:hypothetical protein